MTLEKDSNFGKKLTFCLKNHMKSFYPSRVKSESLHFDGLLLYKYVTFEPKKIQRSCVVKNNLWFKNDISNLVNFHISS